jgi:hypothetical protein
LEFQLGKRGGEGIGVRPEFTQVSEHVVIGSTRWQDEEGGRHERYQVVTLRDDKIVDMQDFKSRRQAERFARKR